MSDSILTKRMLLNLLEHIGDDDPIRVKVDTKHLQAIEFERTKYMLDCDVEMLERSGWANLSVGAGIGGPRGGITLSTVDTKDQ